MTTPARIPPKTVGPYKLGQRLGKGGMGVVYRAWDERLRRHVAIKHVHAKDAQKANIRQRFRLEARTVARLNHAAIVQIYDILETDDGDWIVMELVEGRTLRELMDRRELPLPRAIRLAREVAAGLAVAHSQGIVHRDLKMENVMVTEKGGAGRAKILDFGLAKRLEKKDPGDTTLSGDGMVVGTVRAMSPEQIMEEEIDTRSDLFSLGTLLYEMCTGISPFEAENVVTTMTKVCRHRQPSVASLAPEVSKELSDFIDRLLEKDPERRPRSALEVVKFFDQLTGETTVLPPLDVLTTPEPKSSEEDPMAPFAPTEPMETLVAGVPAPPPSAPPESGIAIKTLISTEIADRSALEGGVGSESVPATLARLAEARQELAKEYFGQELRPGDGTLLMFERPASAVEFALAYHRKVSAIAREIDAPLAVRQGIHLGEVVLAAGDADSEVGELTEATAVGVMALARSGQILFTQSVDEIVRRSSIARRFGDQEVSWREHGLYRLPGVDEEVEVFEVGFVGDAPFTAPARADTGSRRSSEGGRWAWAVGIGAGVVVLVFLGIRGCL